ncbi:Alpha/beta hydrolase [[Mycoplasma] cavipharyngis]|uniref:alpha/beta hydrolase n=1 Tax=[Mycoplasma] cavipharyngis TaxID=92757 RepID=UPI003704C158
MNNLTISIFNYHVEYIEKLNPNAQKTIVFVHGFTSNFELFEPVAQHLSEYNYYALNLPGHGNTLENEIQDFDLLKYADLLLEFIKLKKLKNVHAIGHSMGGGVCSFAIAKEPEHFAKLILVAPWNKTSQQTGWATYFYFFPKSLKDFYQLVLKYQFDFDFNDYTKIKQVINWIRLINSNTLRAIGYRVLGPSMLTNFLIDKIDQATKKLQLPVLLVYGDRDFIINVSAIKQYYQANVSNLTIKVFPNTGHKPWSNNLIPFVNLIKTYFD